jgi:hypothetical protein
MPYTKVFAFYVDYYNITIKRCKMYKNTFLKKFVFIIFSLCIIFVFPPGIKVLAAD